MNIPEPHYTFEFEGLSDRLGRGNLHITDHHIESSFTIQVSVDDTHFLKLRGLQVDSHVADLVDLAVAISEADRWTQRNLEFANVIQVCLPVRNLEIFQSEEIKAHIQQMMYWFTGDYWIFDFKAFSKQHRHAELQRPFWRSSNNTVKAEVALWSGGLDALAGLCNRIEQGVADRFLLFGAGANKYMRGVQKRIYQQLQHAINADLNLMQLHIYQRGAAKAGLRPDKHVRARGAVFMLLGSAYARLEGQKSLALYENGVGAINLPFRASEVGVDHARSVHPLSLLYVSQLVSLILEERFVVHNPFLWWTKAEMCKVLVDMEIGHIGWQTVSCDRRHHKENCQCGGCSSCILRRQSLQAAGIPDNTKYLIHKDTDIARNRLLKTSHLPHMVFQKNALHSLTADINGWRKLARQHPSRIADMVTRLSFDGDESREALTVKVVSLLRRYADEWAQSNVSAIFEQEIEDIKRILKQEAHDGLQEGI